MPSSRSNPIPAFIIMVQVVILDQLTKILVRLNLDLHESIPILPNLFGDTFLLTHVTNKGAAFGLSLGSDIFNRFFFVGAALLAVAMMIYLLYNNTHRLQVIAFGLIMGGALGNNALDRVIIGGVTDFIDVDIPNILNFSRFPIFNVADSCIFIGVVLLIIEMFFIKKPAAAPEAAPAQIEVNNKEI